MASRDDTCMKHFVSRSKKTASHPMNHFDIHAQKVYIKLDQPFADAGSDLRFRRMGVSPVVTHRGKCGQRRIQQSCMSLD